MTARATLGDRDVSCGPNRRIDPRPWSDGGGDGASEARRCGDGHSCGADRETDHDGLAHVVASHG